VKNIFKSYIFRKVLPAVLILMLVLIGIIKVDMINTKALSPLGNTNENYKLVSEKFGEDFSKFIKDNSFLKIYKEPEKDMLVRLGESDFKISNQSVFIKKIDEILKNIHR
jgi:squalene cyclase